MVVSEKFRWPKDAVVHDSASLLSAYKQVKWLHGRYRSWADAAPEKFIGCLAVADNGNRILYHGKNFRILLMYDQLTRLIDTYIVWLDQYKKAQYFNEKMNVESLCLILNFGDFVRLELNARIKWKK